MRCSTSRIRSDRVSRVSRSLTGTAPCITTGPASVSGITKWTVAPEIFTPARSAWPCGSRPGKEGSKEGWMLSIRPYQRLANSAVNRRINPPRQISSMPCPSSVDCKTASNPARLPPNGLLSMTRVGIPLALAFARPSASARFEITSAISAGKSARLAAWINATIFEPRPEIRMATRRFIASPRQIEVTIIDHAMFARGLDYFTQQRDAFAAVLENAGDLFDRVRLHDRNHADAAIEGAQQFEFGDAAPLREPFEHRQHRKAREVDPDT